uniref:SANT domain-containing protein n=1 Tax=Rhabditophanes sp. KR3021 TaxID=114890 RepID=A0AC35TP07_9BILA
MSELWEDPPKYTEDLSLDPQYCFFCYGRMLSDPFVFCKECNADGNVLICLNCFQIGSEGGGHLRGHNYAIVNTLGPTVYPAPSESFPSSSNPRWFWEDDKAVFKQALRYRAGNWNNLAAEFKRDSQIARKRFRSFFEKGKYGDVLTKEFAKVSFHSDTMELKFNKYFAEDELNESSGPVDTSPAEIQTECASTPTIVPESEQPESGNSDYKTTIDSLELMETAVNEVRAEMELKRVKIARAIRPYCIPEEGEMQEEEEVEGEIAKLMNAPDDELDAEDDGTTEEVEGSAESEIVEATPEPAPVKTVDRKRKRRGGATDLDTPTSSNRRKRAPAPVPVEKSSSSSSVRSQGSKNKTPSQSSEEVPSSPRGKTFTFKKTKMNVTEATRTFVQVGQNIHSRTSTDVPEEIASQINPDDAAVLTYHPHRDDFDMDYIQDLEANSAMILGQETFPGGTIPLFMEINKNRLVRGWGHRKEFHSVVRNHDVIPDFIAKHKNGGVAPKNGTVAPKTHEEVAEAEMKNKLKEFRTVLNRTEYDYVCQQFAATNVLVDQIKELQRLQEEGQTEVPPQSEMPLLVSPVKKRRKKKKLIFSRPPNKAKSWGLMKKLTQERMKE